MSENLQPQADVVENVVVSATEVPDTKRYKVKVDGVESEVDEVELVNSYQKGRSADKKFQEAADMRKQLESFVEQARADPKQLLEQLGYVPSEWAKQLLLAEIEKEEQAANPDKREIAELKKEVKAIRDGENKKLAELAESKAKAEEDALVASIDIGIGKVLEDMGLQAGQAPAELVSDIAEQMLAEYKASKRNLEPKEALNRAKTSFQRRLNAISKSAPNAILELLSPEHLESIAEAYISKRKPKEVPSIKSSTPARAESKEDSIKNNLNDFFKRKS